MNLEITPEKAEILGLLCAEGNHRGYYDMYFEKDRRRKAVFLRERWKEIIEFSNTDMPLLEHFVKLLSIAYDYEPKITKSNKNVFRVCITKKNIIRDLLRYVKLGCLKWDVPECVLESNDKIKLAFIRGFFDGDGSVDFTRSTPRIRFSSSNRNGLESLCLLLDSFGLEYSLNGPYARRLPSFELLLKTKSVKKFIKLVGSRHSNKSIKFQRIIAEGV
ncbi:MAG: LAGLIDADG family homing endonuclease [Candidatus Aenigmatarchaeota archaeon]